MPLLFVVLVLAAFGCFAFYFRYGLQVAKSYGDVTSQRLIYIGFGLCIIGVITLILLILSY